MAFNGLEAHDLSIIIIIITDVNWTSEGKYLSAMYNQSQGNTQYIRTQVTYKTYAGRNTSEIQSVQSPVTPKTPSVHERKGEQETNKN